MSPPRVAGAVPRGWSRGYSLTLHIKYKSHESVNHLSLQGGPVPAREEQLNERVSRELRRQRKLDIFGGVGVVFFTKYLTVTFLLSSTSLPSALQPSKAEGWKAGPEQERSTGVSRGRRCWSHTPPACTQEGNFPSGAVLLHPLTDILSPFPSGLCCPWAHLQPVTNLDLPLQFTSLSCCGGRLKKQKKNKPRKEYFFFTWCWAELKQEWDILWTYIFL